MSIRRRVSIGSREAESREAGQTTVLVVLILGLFLLAGLAFSSDLSNMWFRRQSAQSAADAACLAGATDLLFTAGGASVPTSAHFPSSISSATTYDCGSTGTAAQKTASALAVMCKYANFNGYNGTGFTTTSAGNAVTYTFPSSITGATAPPASMNVANPFLTVVVTENVKTWFMGLVGRKYQQVSATCSCGVQAVKSAPPLLILDPTDSNTFTVNNSSSITIVGGPQRSIQANSTSSTVQNNGGTVDTHLGGPAGPPGTGSDVAIVGGQSSLAANFVNGTTGKYVESALPIPDPFATVPAPTAAQIAALNTNPATGHVGYHDATYNCPDPSGCDVYSPGHYTANLSVGTATALFIHGVYYLDKNLDAHGTGATLRNAYSDLNTTAEVDGVTFYFNGGEPVLTGSPKTFLTADEVPTFQLVCGGTTSTTLPSGVSTPLNGSVLWGPCMTSGTYTDNTSDSLSSTGLRGILMFADHGNSKTPTPDLTGTGQMAFSGALYFHISTGNVTLKLAGQAGSSTLVLGEIITDQLVTTGGGSVTMALSSKKISNILKVSMLQ